ncbi:MAG: hypothetical protein WDK96_02930 [Candidatus Paceibacterota bacterium]|jgi:hypothetical protein
MNKEKGNIIIWLIVIVGIAWGVYYFLNNEKWDLFYYPDGCSTCSDKWIIKRGFDTLYLCRAEADLLKSKSDTQETDDYICGLNCKVKDSVSVCEKNQK